MALERKTKLSENLLCMKFMQRGLDSETKKQLEEEERDSISDESSGTRICRSRRRKSFIIEEQSFSLCEDPLYGRMHFRGFNPDVEKLMLQMKSKNRAAAAAEDETGEAGVSDEEMARGYETLVGTIGKRLAKKRDQNNYKEDENGNIKAIKTKKMFLKPQD